MIWAKGNDQSAKFNSFDCSRKISPNLYFDKFLLLKLYKILAKKKIERSYVSWHWKVMQSLKKNWFVVSKMMIWSILMWALGHSQNIYFDWFLLCKVYNFWLEKLQRVIFHGIEGWWKIWRKTDLWFGKWHEECGKF